MNVSFLHIHIFTYILLIEIVHVLFDFYKPKKLYTRGFLEYVATTHAF